MAKKGKPKKATPASSPDDRVPSLAGSFNPTGANAQGGKIKIPALGDASRGPAKDSWNYPVIPAQAGIQIFNSSHNLGSRFKHAGTT